MTGQALLWQFAIALIGGLVAGITTLLGVFLSNRQTSKNSTAERRAELRNSRQDAIAEFLNVVQEVEESIDKTLSPQERIALLHKLWLKQKCLEVISSDRLAKASRSYTINMREVVWQNKKKWEKLEDGVWSYMADEK